MKHKKIACLVLAAVLLSLAFSYAAAVFIKKDALKAEKQQYTLYASCYPVYTVASMIIKGVPGMQLKVLTQPQLEGYTAYSLSDWEYDLLSGADAVILMGCGFEGFANEYTSDSAAIITLLSMMELKSPPKECTILNYSTAEGSDNYSSPWYYMSIDGMLELCEIMCGNMSYLDQAYSGLYYQNLDSAIDELEPLLQRRNEFTALEGKNVAVAHAALLYTASDLNANVTLCINRTTAQELTDEQIGECISAMRENNTNILMLEEQAGETMIRRLESAGITVISQDIMLDRTHADSCLGYIDTYNENLNLIEEAMNHQ